MEELKPRLEVCLSPALLHLYDVKNSIVVIIDVLRATSTICTVLYNGASRVIPVASVPECVSIGEQLGDNAITAGERDGRIAEGLLHGNSPFEYPREFIQDKTLVLTTTNGTKLLHMAKDAIEIITGSFPNISAVCDYLIAQGKPVILGCAAWKDRVNMEDTLFAGAVVNRIREHFNIDCDSAIAAEALYTTSKDNMYEVMKQASHYKRLAKFGLEKDIQYCLTPDGANVLPVYRNGELVAAE
ncbi:2-phosphosulfolactate phosphatase [Chitinophaga rhizophila]|uniref:Probable 2-phosphosulfolactate phosphatase n=1 Tax=Chitinophaga rhizophila TaxID=2866212 RepID=A0ABS7GF74_9BACT|nr:2-phosphosulfolactate phosphatase [Chitinophaga rhizophila]MBW8685951.1 2-phosphosulfolactate phosphatase [Chitinophaga rhizophila]